MSDLAAFLADPRTSIIAAKAAILAARDLNKSAHKYPEFGSIARKHLCDAASCRKAAKSRIERQHINYADSSIIMARQIGLCAQKPEAEK